MVVFLLEVEFVFSIAPKKRIRPFLLPPLRDDGPKVQRGTAIVLLLPDGGEIETTIWDLKHFNLFGFDCSKLASYSFEAIRPKALDGLPVRYLAACCGEIHYQAISRILDD